MALAAVILLIGCGGGGGSVAAHFNDQDGSGGMQGNVGPSPEIPGTGVVAGAAPPVGVLDSAPLGTDPAFNTQEISELIQTTRISDSTSSLRAASATPEDRVLWVSITPRGEYPDPGLPSPPITEGYEIDLHIRYLVFEGELSISRQWILEEAGLNFIEPSVTHESPGTYHAIFPFTLAYDTGSPQAKFKGVIGPVRTTSVVIVPDMHDYREVEFEIVETPTLPPLHYPGVNPDADNDSVKHGKGCLPQDISVIWNNNTGFHEGIEVTCDKELSNVVLEFTDGSREKWDNLSGYSGTYFGTGANSGKEILVVWVKSGCNESGDGPGYGERFNNGQIQEMAMAEFAWDDDTIAPDYDYNDFVGRMNIAETRNANNELVQVQITAKAMARATAYDASWQFNIGASFPGATQVFAVVNQYYDDGTPHGPQRIYESAGGMSIPIFSPTRNALPNPPGSFTTNGMPGTEFIYGDYAEILVILHQPQAQGSYEPMPYEPELLVKTFNGDVYPIQLWRAPGDPLNADGYPQAFIVPDTFAWPLEGEPIWNVYPEFNDWIDWIHNPSLPRPKPDWWDYAPLTGSDFFQRELFL